MKFHPPMIFLPLILTIWLIKGTHETITCDPDKMSILKYFKPVGKKENDLLYQIKVDCLGNGCHCRLLK